jgi:hypothetical protein
MFRGKADSVDSIVAIHGPNGHPERTWARETDATPPRSIMWLRDFLPDKLPNARIMTFGYDSQVAFSRGTATVKDSARRLIVLLKQKRADALN